MNVYSFFSIVSKAYSTYLYLVTHQTHCVLERNCSSLDLPQCFEHVVPRYVALRKLNKVVVNKID